MERPAPREVQTSLLKKWKEAREQQRTERKISHVVEGGFVALDCLFYADPLKKVPGGTYSEVTQHDLVTKKISGIEKLVTDGQIIASNVEIVNIRKKSGDETHPYGTKLSYTLQENDKENRVSLYVIRTDAGIKLLADGKKVTKLEDARKYAETITLIVNALRATDAGQADRVATVYTAPRV